MSIRADPITAAVITMAGVRGIPLLGFMVRKEAKGHGTKRFIEGPVSAGDSVVIVEDVVTTGGSSLEAIARCEEYGLKDGLKVSRVVAIIDRCEGGAEAFSRGGYPFSSLLTIRDFGIQPPTDAASS
jgi:orotate phosphoribosyltransferase